MAFLPTVKKKVAAAKTEIYQPREEDGYIYPPESKIVQLKTMDLIQRFKEVDQELIDLCATQDYANCNAKANILIDGAMNSVYRREDKWAYIRIGER